LNIAINTRTLLSTRMEGVARYTFETAKRLVALHPEHQFYFFFDRSYDPSFIFAQNVTPIVLFPQARHPYLWYYWFEYSLTKALKKFEIDVLYSTDSYLSLRTTVPTVLVSHDLAYLHYPEHIPPRVRSYYQKYFPKFHEKADHIIAVSEATCQDIQQAYRIPKEKITVAHNACSPHFQTLSFNEKVSVKRRFTNGKPYFIYLGSIHPRKNIQRLIYAFEQFLNKTGNSHELVLLGRWAWRTTNIASAKLKSKYKDRIRLFTDHEDHIADLVAAAEAMCYVSLFEGFGIPILEAMQSGVPVITSNKSSMPEVAGDAAYLVDPESVDEIAHAMQTITDNKNLRQEFIAKGHANVKRFSWDRSASLISGQISSLL